MTEFENELTIDYILSLPMEFEKYFDYDLYVSNHNKNKVISICLFNKNVNVNETEENDPFYFKEKYLKKLFPLVDKMNKTEYGVNIFTEEKFKDLLNMNNVNVYIMKHSLGALGSLWRFLSIDFHEEVLFCDIDEDELNPYLLNSKNTSRYLSHGVDDYIVCKKPLSKKYSPILAGLWKLKKEDFPFNMKELICKFFYHQLHNQSKERDLIFNEAYDHFNYGFGNNPINYGTDERFIAKIIYFYLVKNGKLDTYYRCFKNKENLEDIEYCKKYNNKVNYI